MYAENAAVQLSLENFEKVIKQVAEDKKTEVLKAKQQEEEKKKFSQGNQKLVYDDTKINPRGLGFNQQHQNLQQEQPMLRQPGNQV